MGRKVDLQNTNTHTYTLAHSHTQRKLAKKLQVFFSCVFRAGYAAPSLSFFKRRRTMTLCACAIVVVAAAAAAVGAAAFAGVVVVS